jgi:hypothetical protein
MPLSACCGRTRPQRAASAGAASRRERRKTAQCCVVVVAYATSQGTQQVYGGEFVVPASVVSGLTKDTKFDLVNRHALPFNDAWFAPASKTNPPHPTRGKLDLTNDVLKRKLHAAVKEAENLRKGQQTPLRRPPVAPTISCRESQAARPEALGGLEVGNRDKPRGRGKLTLTLFSTRSPSCSCASLRSL